MGIYFLSFGSAAQKPFLIPDYKVHKKTSTCNFNLLDRSTKAITEDFRLDTVK